MQAGKQYFMYSPVPLPAVLSRLPVCQCQCVFQAVLATSVRLSVLNALTGRLWTVCVIWPRL